VATRNLNALQPAKNIGALPPTKTRYDDDGVPRVEKLNPIPMNRKMVDPDGNVVSVSLATGFTIRGGPHNGWKDNPYGSQKWMEKLAAGFVPYDECPYHPQSGVQLYAPEMFQASRSEKACTDKFTREQCCSHIERCITARRTVKQKKNVKFSKAFASHADRQLEVLEKAVMQQVAGSTPAPTEAPPTPRKGNGPR